LGVPPRLSHTLPLLLAAWAGCSTVPPKEPTRSPQGLFVTGRQKYDSHFHEVRSFETSVEALEARVRALAPPVARVLELPGTAGTWDLAMALRKVVKRAARHGVQAEIRVMPSGTSPTEPSVRLVIDDDAALPARFREALDVAAKSVAEAIAIRPEIDAAIVEAERLRVAGEDLGREVRQAFARRGSNYVEAVNRELTRSAHRMEDVTARLVAARGFVVTFSDDLASASRLDAHMPSSPPAP